MSEDLVQILLAICLPFVEGSCGGVLCKIITLELAVVRAYLRRRDLNVLINLIAVRERFTKSNAPWVKMIEIRVFKMFFEG
jgi:hypothetical protein